MTPDNKGQTKKAARAATQGPLLTPKIMTRIIVLFAILAVMTVAISIGGRWVGQSMSMGGHTDKTDINDIFIDRDHLRISSNVIRFPNQRHTGTTEQVNLQFTWPEMEGYTSGNSSRFNDQSQSETMIFIELSQRIMTLDMSNRMQPIYSNLLEANSLPGPAGLTIHPFKADGPYKTEYMLTADRPGKAPFAIRCMLPLPGASTSSADCQRDVYMGQDLSVMIRYSSKLLPQWEAIDSAVEKVVKSMLAE